MAKVYGNKTRLKQPDEILEFLGCPTPAAWLEEARKYLDILLIDHAHCERKAASSAISLISQYPQNITLVNTLSHLAREELRHFELVLRILKARNITFCALTASRYARCLHKLQRTNGEGRLIDLLLTAAFIEARSCERFSALQTILPNDLKIFYAKLCQAEARHFQIYLQLAEKIDRQDFTTQLEIFKKTENDLILGKDSQFRFHSGIPENV